MPMGWADVEDRERKRSAKLVQIGRGKGMDDG